MIIVRRASRLEISRYPGLLRLSAHRPNVDHLLSRVVLYAISPDNKTPALRGF
jgi:hypothetical protein